MKTMFVYGKSNADVRLPEEYVKLLPKRVGIVTTIQHLHKIKDVQEQLEGSLIGGQLLGCKVETAERIAYKVDAFLYIGSGDFHPIAVQLKTGKIVYCWNPSTKNFRTIDAEKVEEYKRFKKGQLLKFLSAETVGILISTKLGQNDNKINRYSEELKMKKALELKKRGDKKYYLFACDTLNWNNLEDFPFIDVWVNTACPRIADEKAGIINIDDVMKFLNEEVVVENAS